MTNVLGFCYSRIGQSGEMLLVVENWCELPPVASGRRCIWLAGRLSQAAPNKGERFQGVGRKKLDCRDALRRRKAVGRGRLHGGAIQFDCGTLCWVMRSLFDSQSVPDH